MSRTVFITGGSRGIGLELCKKFKANGDTVVTSCRVLTPELEALNIETIPNIDVTKGQDCQTLKQLFNKRQVDILINCAGLLHCETLEQMDFEDILRQFEVNSMAPLRVTHSLLNSLNHGSKVVIVTSRMGSIEDNSSGAYYGYRMSKAAVNMAGKSLANDLFHDGISVGLLHPGFVKTRMTNFSGDVTPEESVNNLFNRIEELTLQQSGSFIHANGQKLPW